MRSDSDLQIGLNDLSAAHLFTQPSFALNRTSKLAHLHLKTLLCNSTSSPSSPTPFSPSSALFRTRRSLPYHLSHVGPKTVITVQPNTFWLLNFAAITGLAFGRSKFRQNWKTRSSSSVGNLSKSDILRMDLMVFRVRFLASLI